LNLVFIKKGILHSFKKNAAVPLRFFLAAYSDFTIFGDYK